MKEVVIRAIIKKEKARKTFPRQQVETVKD
jgi:hypothetical protein